MGRRRKGEVPQLRHHKASGLAFVWVNGKADYLGGVKWGSPEATDAYRDFLRRWQSAHPATPYRAPKGAAVAQLAKEYVDSLVAGHGEKSQQVRETRRAIKPLAERFGAKPADTISHDDLETVQAAMVAAGLTKGVINARVGRLRRMFRYGVRRNLVDAATVVRLESLPDIPSGHPGVPEDVPVMPVNPKIVRKTLPYLNRHVRALVELQMTIGCRAGEICRMRGEEIDQQGIVRLQRHQVKLPGGVWVWQPERHKTRRRGKVLAYILGPKAQKLLRPWLRPGYLFSAQECRAESYARSRKTKAAGPAKPITGKRVPHAYYLPSSYWWAVNDACERAGVPHWHPHQLRHLVASRIDHAEGIEASRTLLGHSSVASAAIYAETDYRKAARIAKKYG